MLDGLLIRALIATGKIKIEGRFPMHRGDFFESPTIACETWGEFGRWARKKRVYCELRLCSLAVQGTIQRSSWQISLLVQISVGIKLLPSDQRMTTYLDREIWESLQIQTFVLIYQIIIDPFWMSIIVLTLGSHPIIRDVERSIQNRAVSLVDLLKEYRANFQ